MPKRLLITLPILVAAAAFAWWWFSPEQIVKRRVKGMLGVIEVPATMSDLARGTRGPKLAAYLAPTVVFRPSEALQDRIGSEYPRDSIAGMFSATARYCRSISIEEIEFQSIAIVDGEADVSLRFDAVVEAGEQRPADGIQNVNMRWNQSPEGWQLGAVQWSESPR